MKWVSIFLFLAALCLGPAPALAQGTVNFSNLPNLFSDGIDRTVYAGYCEPLVGTNYVAQLLYGLDASSLVPVTSAPAKFRDTTAIGTMLAGTWSGGTRTLGTMSAGQVATLDVVIWDITRFQDLASAIAGGGILDNSATFQYLIPPPGSPPAAFTMTGYHPGVLIGVPVACPKPSMVMLSIVGVGGVLFLGRRKRLG